MPILPDDRVGMLSTWYSRGAGRRFGRAQRGSPGLLGSANSVVFEVWSDEVWSNASLSDLLALPRLRNFDQIPGPWLSGIVINLASLTPSGPGYRWKHRGHPPRSASDIGQAVASPSEVARWQSVSASTRRPTCCLHSYSAFATLCTCCHERRVKGRGGYCFIICYSNTSH